MSYLLRSRLISSLPRLSLWCSAGLVFGLGSAGCGAGDGGGATSNRPGLAQGTEASAGGAGTGTALAPGQEVGVVNGMMVVVDSNTNMPVLDGSGAMIPVTGGATTGTTGSAATTGSAGAAATGTSMAPPAMTTDGPTIDFDDVMPAEVEACNELMVGFEKLEPTVLLVIDRSTDMRDPVAGEAQSQWDALRSALIAPGGVIEQFQGDVDFGMITYTSRKGAGEEACFFGDGGAVELAVNIPPGPMAFDAISAAYNAAEPGLEGNTGESSETPTRPTLEAAMDILNASTTDGKKYILLVTNGLPDTCNDPDPCIPMDDVLATTQAAYAAGFTTFAMTVATGNANLSEHVAQVAAVGQGQPIDVRQTCSHATALATYTTGAAPEDLSYKADSQAQIAEQMGRIIGGVRSCEFVMGKDVYEDKANLGTVALTANGTTIEFTFGDPNGWTLTPPNVVTLQGEACTQLQTVVGGEMNIEFPCESFIR